MPVHGKAPVVQLVTNNPSLEDRAKDLLEGRVIETVALEKGHLKLALDSGQTLDVFVGDSLEEV
jgi:hypothetical protein